MGARQHVYGVGLEKFSLLLRRQLHEVVASLLPESAELYAEHPWSFLSWSSKQDGDINYCLCSDSRIKLIQNARIRHLQADDLPSAPGMRLTIREFITNNSSYQLHWLLKILALSRSCDFVISIVDGQRRWWIHSLLESAAYWFGRQSEDFARLDALLIRLLRIFGDVQCDLRSMDFPVLPTDDGDLWMAVWSPTELEEAVLCFQSLLDSGAKFARHDSIGYPETDDKWDAWVRGIVQRLIALGEMHSARPSVVSFVSN